MVEMHVEEIPDNLGRELSILWGERSQFIEGQSLLKKKVRRTSAHWWLTAFLLMKDVGWEG